MSVYQKGGKRAFDIIVSAQLLAGLLPFWILIVLILRFKQGKGVFFTQERPGKNGKLFILYKFRTMTKRADLPLSERVTTTGAFLRRYKIDELPQLWNVLLGDMSLVGPRPLLSEYLTRYNARQATRHAVKPGLTGWAQTSGGNALSWPERLELDARYAENVTFVGDLTILFRTFRVIFSPEPEIAFGRLFNEEN